MTYKAGKKYPDVFLRASHTKFESCDNLTKNNYTYNDAYQIILPNTRLHSIPQKRLATNGLLNGPNENSSMTCMDFMKCANQKDICKTKIIKANQIANKGKTSQGNTFSEPDENKGMCNRNFYMGFLAPT